MQLSVYFIRACFKKNSSLHIPSIIFKVPYFNSFWLLFLISSVNLSLETVFHHYTVHMFVHHCTFCASLHVKTSPVFHNMTRNVKPELLIVSSSLSTNTWSPLFLFVSYFTVVGRGRILWSLLEWCSTGAI